ncbi:DUF885 domain-containing protein [bacterium]|nr:DUF885 domain-containing protein [bacterium]
MTQSPDQLVDEILEFIWQENPVEATMAGIHRYDDRLERCDQVSRRNKLRRKKEYVTGIEVLQKEGRSNDELDLLCCALRVGIGTEERLHTLDRDPGIYPRLIIYGIYQLIARSGEPYHYRALRAIERMREVPRLLSEGRLNLTYGEGAPRLWNQAAIDFMHAGRQYLDRITGMLAAEVPELSEVLRKYAEEALAAFDSYLEFLQDEIAPSADGSFGVGEEMLGFLIRYEHKLEDSVESLRDLAHKEVEAAQAQLETAAAAMDGSSNWRRCLRRIDEAAAPSDLRAWWEGIIGEVWQAVSASGLVSLPPAEGLSVVETPPFERPTIPVAGYVPAAPLEDNSHAFFCVTPAESGESGDPAQTVNWHSRPRALLYALRELYPGRHTLLTLRRQANPRLAYLTCHNLLEDGWCSYAVNLVLSASLLNEPELLLLAAHEKLVAAWRMLTDLELHSAELNEDLAVENLVMQTGLSQEEAAFEVRRLAINPASSFGAVVGRIQIENLRRELSAGVSGGPPLLQFHDDLLRLSALPISRVAARIAGGRPRKGSR